MISVVTTSCVVPVTGAFEGGEGAAAVEETGALGAVDDEFGGRAAEELGDGATENPEEYSAVDETEAGTADVVAGGATHFVQTVLVLVTK